MDVGGIPIEKGWNNTILPLAGGRRGKSRIPHLVFSTPWMIQNSRAIQACTSDTRKIRGQVLYEKSPYEYCKKCNSLNKHTLDKVREQLDGSNPIDLYEHFEMASWHILQHLILPHEMPWLKNEYGYLLTGRLLSNSTVELNLKLSFKCVPWYTLSKSEKNNIDHLLSPFQKDRYDGFKINLTIPLGLKNRYEALHWATSLDMWSELEDYIHVCKTIHQLYNQPPEVTTEQDEERVAALVALKLGVFHMDNI
jgi:hypothetical protein